MEHLSNKYRAELNKLIPHRWGGWGELPNHLFHRSLNNLILWPEGIVSSLEKVYSSIDTPTCARYLLWCDICTILQDIRTRFNECSCEDRIILSCIISIDTECFILHNTLSINIMSNGTSIHLDEEHSIRWLEFCLHLTTLEEKKSDTHKKSCQDSNSNDDSNERFSTILTKHRDDIWSIIKYSYTLKKPKRNMRIFSNHRGMTLIELIVGISITGLVLSALLYFLVGSASQIASLQWQNSTVSWLSELSDTITSIRRSYSSWEIIYENGQNKGYDVILFSRRENSWVLNGILMGVVIQSGSTLSYLDRPSEYNMYEEKKFGFLKIGDAAINSILSVTGSLREDVLFGSGGTPWIDMSDALLTQNLLPLAFDAKSYNSGAITEAKIEITPQFFPDHSGEATDSIDLDRWSFVLDF